MPRKRDFGSRRSRRSTPARFRAVGLPRRDTPRCRSVAVRSRPRTGQGREGGQRSAQPGRLAPAGGRRPRKSRAGSANGRFRRFRYNRAAPKTPQNPAENCDSLAQANRPNTELSACHAKRPRVQVPSPPPSKSGSSVHPCAGSGRAVDQTVHVKRDHTRAGRRSACKHLRILYWEDAHYHLRSCGAGGSSLRWFASRRWGAAT